MNPRIRLISAKVEVGVEVEAELGNFVTAIITTKFGAIANTTKFVLEASTIKFLKEVRSNLFK